MCNHSLFDKPPGRTLEGPKDDAVGYVGEHEDGAIPDSEILQLSGWRISRVFSWRSQRLCSNAFWPACLIKRESLIARNAVGCFDEPCGRGAEMGNPRRVQLIGYFGELQHDAVASLLYN